MAVVIHSYGECIMLSENLVKDTLKGLSKTFKIHASLKRKISYVKWASTRENLSSGVCEQHRRRPACASAQSDQRLCYLRYGKYHFKACYKRNFIFLASLCS